MRLFSRFRQWVSAAGGEPGNSVSGGRSLLLPAPPGSPLSYAPLLRCVSLLSKDAARLVCKTLAEVDEKGYLRAGRRQAERVRRLRRMVDGVRDSYAFWKRVFVDLLMTGNAYLVPLYRGDVLEGLRRLYPESVQFQEQDYQGRVGVYFGREESTVSQVERYTEQAVVHATFTPQGHQDSIFFSGDRRIAPSPVKHIARLIATALVIEGRIEQHYRLDPKARLWISPTEGPVGEDTLDEIAASVQASILSGRPMFLNERVAVAPIQDSSVNNDTAMIQGRLLRAVSTIYGVPPAMLGEGTSAVKVESLLREYWKGLGQLLDDVLEPLSQRLLLPGNSFAVDQSHLIRGDYATAIGVIKAAFPNTGAPKLGFLREGRRLLPFGPITREEEEELESSGTPPEEPVETPRPGLPQPGQPEPSEG